MASTPAPRGLSLSWVEADPPAVLGPVLVQSAVEVVVERLATAFALDLYPPGSKLPPERALAARLGVSRGTIRQAIAELEALGFVEVRLGRYGGTSIMSSWSDSSPALVRRVLGDHWREYEDLFDLARQLMPMTAGLAAERRTGKDLERIAEAVDAYAASDAREIAREADAAVHRAIARATQNAYLVSADAQLRAQLTLGTGAFPYSPDIVTQAVAEHALLYKQIRQGDASGAASTALRHFVELGEQHLRAIHAKATR